MLSEHFEHKLMKIGLIELELLKFLKWTHKKNALYMYDFDPGL